MRTLYRDAGYANVEAEPETELDPVHEQVDIIVPIKRGPPVYIERIEIKGNTKTRDKVIRREMEIEEGQLFSETGAREQQAAHHGARLLRARRRLDRAGLGARQAQRQRRGRREADRHVPGRRGLQLDRELHRHRAGPAGEPVRQRPVARPAGAGLRRCGSSSRSASSSRTSSTATGTRASSSTTRSTSSRTSRGARVGGSLTFGYALIQPWLRLSVTATTEWDSVDTSSTTTFFGTATPGFASVFQQLPLANLFNSGRVFSLRPTITYDTRDNRLFPTSGVYLQASTELASAGVRQRVQLPAPPLHGPLLLPARRRHGAAGLGVRPQAEHRARAHHEPRPAGRPDLPALLPRRHPRRARLLPAQHRPAPAARRTRSTRTRRPSPTARTSAVTSQDYENLELEFPIIDKVGIRGVVFFDAGNAWNTEDQFCKTTPAPQFDRVVQPVLHRQQPRLPPHVDGLRHPLVLAARPAALRVGLPAGPAPLRKPQRLRVHDRQLLLREKTHREAGRRGEIRVQ